MTRYLIAACSGARALIPDDEPETDHEALIEKYWSRLEPYKVHHCWIED